MKNKMLLLIFLLATVGIYAQEIRVHPNTCLKVEPGTILDISSGNLIVESNETGDASLIDFGDVTYNGGGEAIVQRYLIGGQWHLISAPVNNALAGMFLDDYLQFHTEGTNDWTDISAEDYHLLPMQGYSLWSVETGPTTQIFLGVTNTDLYEKAFAQNGSGWNLFGNPYPSAIDWDALTLPSQLSAAICLFDATIGLEGDYRYYINGGGGANTTTQYIPSGQGFFVRAVDGGGTMTIANVAMVHNEQGFYKNTEDEAMLVLKARGNDVTSQTAIRFNENATSEIDRLFDVHKIICNSPDVPNLYTKCEDQPMAINTLPSISKHETVPTWFEAGMDGNYSILATELNTIPEEVPVYLEDVALNYLQDLKAKPEYVFDYTSSEVRDFKIHFKDVTGIEDLGSSSVPAIQCYLSNDKLHVNFTSDGPEGWANANIDVYTISGQLILSRAISRQKNEITFSGSQAAYL